MSEDNKRRMAATAVLLLIIVMAIGGVARKMTHSGTVAQTDKYKREQEAKALIREEAERAETQAAAEAPIAGSAELPEAESGSDTGDGSDTKGGADTKNGSDAEGGADMEDGSDTKGGADTEDGADTKGESDAKAESDRADGFDTAEGDLPEYGTTKNDLPSVRASAKLPALAVKKGRLVNAKGKTVQLRGVSTHGLAWFPDYVNEDCFAALHGWGANVMRLAMYTEEYGGYCAGGDKKALKKLVKDGVNYATKEGMYVIIDWHILSDGNPKTHQKEAKKFFKEMSREFASYTNVLYEICNEPNGGTTWKDIKSYAKAVIPVICKNDPDAVIIVGTPNWSQRVDEAAADPIKGYDNLMYALHFYAGTHKDDLRSTMEEALKKKLPIFVTEYGICDASGNGAIDKTSAKAWVKLLDKYKVSYVAWNLSNKDETSSLLKSSVLKTGKLKKSDLSESGKWVYKQLAKSKA